MNTAPLFQWALERELTLEEWTRFCQEVTVLAEEGLAVLVAGQTEMPCPPNVWKWVWKKRQTLFFQSHTPAYQWGSRGAANSEPVLALLPGPHRVGHVDQAHDQALRVLRFAHKGQQLLIDELFYLPIVASIAHAATLRASPWSFTAPGLSQEQLREWQTWRCGVLASLARKKD